MIGLALRSDGRLWSGESIETVIALLVPTAPLGVLITHTSPRIVGPAVELLSACLAGTGVWCGVRAHLPIAREKPTNWPSGHHLPISYAMHATRWLATGATVIGGCCGTDPTCIAQLSAMRQRLRQNENHAD
jgi:S-methylmethionine-dependent homocysteine/selenocysteine methylase